MIPNNCVLTCWYSSPGSGSGVFMFGDTPYDTAPCSAPCSAHDGIGLDRSLPTTPSNEHLARLVEPSEKVVEKRFSNIRTTTWSRAALLSGAMTVAILSQGMRGPSWTAVRALPLDEKDNTAAAAVRPIEASVARPPARLLLGASQSVPDPPHGGRGALLDVPPRHRPAAGPGARSRPSGSGSSTRCRSAGPRSPRAAGSCATTASSAAPTRPPCYPRRTGSDPQTDGTSRVLGCRSVPG